MGDSDNITGQCGHYLFAYITTTGQPPSSDTSCSIRKLSLPSPVVVIYIFIVLRVIWADLDLAYGIFIGVGVPSLIFG